MANRGRERRAARRRSSDARAAVWLALALALVACTGESGPALRVRVPPGATFRQVADSLDARGIVPSALVFRIYARLAGADEDIKAGAYAFRRGAPWPRILEDLRLGRVLTFRLTVPEGWDLQRIAARIGALSNRQADSVLGVLLDSATAQRFGVPGPTLEGYLYPATYQIPVDAPLDTLIGRMVVRYRSVWTPARLAQASVRKLTEREAVTLASIIEREVKRREEMPLISAVYHNRLRIGVPLRADPTVQYALGQHRRRLLYAHIDSVARSPYNTYRHRGLPPGPIASPSVQAIEAALYPAPADYLYFVARPDGSHIFTRSLEEHNRVKAALRRNERALRRRPLPGGGGSSRPAAP
ncbi:MAG: endolytic transglycosylase MltG [Gemmatimonadetes bacterium]|nr:endolytic transglycosylase MltG [Gemmatimonadota bacterium]